ncbi:MAG TPA: hypothetical protein VFL83_15620 [Anaeromyxobacter sp.]|nr:hypothetical protein [Anaeromyxobacter sp.]
MRRPVVTAALAAALAACTGEPMRDPGIAAFRENAVAIGDAAAAYHSGAATMADADACASARAAYDADVRPMVERAREMAVAMDAHMAEMGRAGHADMACAAQAMMDELDRHAGAACASQGDMAPNVAEVGAHAGAMSGWAEHERARCDELGAMMGGGGMGGMGGGMMDPGTTRSCPAAP